jgi:PPE-repeat protein
VGAASAASTAAGQTLSVAVSLIGGTATGGGAADATADGQTIAVAALLLPGAASGNAVEQPKGAAGDNYRRPRKRRRTWTLAEWQEEQRRRRLPPQAGEFADVELPPVPQPIPSPPGMALPTGALAGLIPPLELPPLPLPRAVPAAWQDEDEDLELLLLA